MVAANATQSAYPRQYVPNDFVPDDFAKIEPLLNELRQRPIGSATELERFLLELSELSSVIDEFGTRRYIDKSCHTDDEKIMAAYMAFVEQIEPECKQPMFELQKKFLDSPYRAQLTDPRYAILSRQWQADVDLFDEANIPLETEVTKIVTEYDRISGAQMVEFRGKEYTQQQMGRFGEEPDRATREAAWRASTERRLQDREAIDGLFEQVLPIRGKIAANSKLPDFRAFVWKQYKRFDYTPEDCLRFADAIVEHVVPLVDALDRRRAIDLGLLDPNAQPVTVGGRPSLPLRPWDMSVDPKNRPPLRPFDESDIDGFVSKTHAIIGRLSPQLADEFDSLRVNGNLDLGSRKGKQPGGYQSTLSEVRQPFIFMNAAGMHRDVDVLLHEGGHAFHALAAKDEPLTFLRHAPMEFCEVASMSMELFGAEHLDLLYADAEANRARRQQLEGIIRFFPWMATIDTFQHWLYTHPGHSRAERTQAWLDITTRFGSKLDWTGLEAARESGWQRQLHLFHCPFYYVEYGIAQLGALQLWMKSKEDPKKALANYRSALKLGGTRPLPDLFKAAGISFDFSEKTIRPLMNAIGEELERLPA